METGRIVAIAAASALMSVLAACSPQAEQGAPQRSSAPPATLPQTPPKSGEELFRQYCATCHPDGGNVSDPRRNLRRSTLRANHITKPEDIIRIMRKPVSRMIAFDRSTISDRDARAIAEYVLTAF